jgi:3-dehydroquinate synthase
VIEVTAASGRYAVHCRWGAIDDLGGLLRDAGLAGSAFVLTSETIAPICGERALASLDAAGFETYLHTIPDGERHKTLDTVRGVYDRLLDCHAERTTTVIGLGGGVVGDLAGFVAATYMRGVPFVQCPTTLLAMVDASIGGKVGVDHARGKNLIGAFYPPRLVVQDTSLLATLPDRPLREGFAEIIKHGLIMEAPMLDALEQHATRLLGRDPAMLTELVARNAALKATVVSEDEREGGRRMILNYGHTIGHAIEAVTGYSSVCHGEAISAGMMAAARIGAAIGVTRAGIIERQQRLFDVYGLPTTLAGIDAGAVLAATAHDKKVSAKRVRWILLEEIARPVIRDDVPDGAVREALAAVLG